MNNAMKLNTQLIVWSQDSTAQYIVDLKEAEEISLQYSFQDIKKFESKGSYSRTFRVPATANNAQAFGFMHEPNLVASGYNPKLKMRAEIRVESMPVVAGNVQLKASYTSYFQNVELTEYEIVFFGNVIDFMRNVGDKDFKTYIGPELQNDYPLVMSYSNVDTINNSSDIAVGVADRGQNWVGMVNQSGARSIYATDTQSVMKFNDLMPFVRCRYIMDKIMQLAGYVLDETLSATFLSMLDHTYIPWTSASGFIQSVGNVETAKFNCSDGISGATIDTSNFYVFSGISGAKFFISHLPVMTEVYDPDNNVVNNVYTAPFSGDYNIKARVTSEIDDASPMYANIYLAYLKTEFSTGIQTLIEDFYNASMTLFNPSSGQVILNTPYTASLGLNTSDWDGTVFLSAGDTIEPIALYGYAFSPTFASTTLPWAGTLTFHNDSFFRCEQVVKAAYGSVIDWAANAPQMKLTEFLSSWMNMMNLVVVPDKFQSNKVAMIPLMEYLEQGTIKDWTRKIDLSKDVVITSTTDYQARKNTWTYKQSNDFLNDAYFTEGLRVYGRLELLDPQNDFASSDNKIELMFGPNPNALISGTDYPIPKYISNTGQYVNPTPRVLYRCSGNTIEVNIYDDAAYQIVSKSFDLFSHYSEVIPTLDSDDLNFGQEIPLHPISSTPYKTLYARFWNDYIDSIYAPDARIMDAFFAVSYADIYDFQFNDKIFVKDAYWRVLDIQGYVIGTTESVKMKLIKIVEVEPACKNKPDQFIYVDGSVPFVDPDGNPVAATETCCVYYGYQWFNGKCWAVKPDSTGGGGKPKSSKDIVKITQTLTDQTKTTSAGVISTNTNVGLNNSTIISNASNSTIGNNNSTSIVSGTDNRVDNNLGSVVVTGDKADAINGGITIGGNGAYRGEFQSGTMVVQGAGTLNTAFTTIQILTDGNKDVKLPDDCIWNAHLQLSIAVISGGIVDTLVGEYAFHWESAAGTPVENNWVLIYESATDVNMSVNFANSSSGANAMGIRFNITGASAYPIDVKVSGTLTYNQYSYV